MNYYNSVIEAIGHTPLIKLSKLTAGLPVTILAKVEYFNPGGSVKDRIGLAMIEDAERRGLLKPGGTIVLFGVACLLAIMGIKKLMGRHSI